VEEGGQLHSFLFVPQTVLQVGAIEPKTRLLKIYEKHQTAPLQHQKINDIVTKRVSCFGLRQKGSQFRFR